MRKFLIVLAVLFAGVFFAPAAQAGDHYQSPKPTES